VYRFLFLVSETRVKFNLNFIKQLDEQLLIFVRFYLCGGTFSMVYVV
jgi:hypothetical protein